MNSYLQTLNKLIPWIYIYLLFFVIQGLILNKGVGDFYAHFDILIEIFHNGVFYPTFGYHLITWLASGLSFNFDNILFVSFFIIPAFTTLKIWILNEFIRNEISGYDSSNKLFCSLPWALLIGFFHPVILSADGWYLGKISPNIWHNPTYIAMIPFSIWLFYRTNEFIDSPEKSWKKIITLLLINLAFKPSFLFSYLPAISMFSFYKYFKRNTKRILIINTVLLFAGLGILIQYHLIYVFGALNSYTSNEVANRIIISFFDVWRYWLSQSKLNLFTALITSFLFPLVLLSLYWSKVKDSQNVWISLILTVFSILIALIFAESDFRKYHGNFFWTAHASSLILIAACLVEFLKIERNKSFRSAKSRIVLFSFLIHVFSGVLFVIRTILFF